MDTPLMIIAAVILTGVAAATVRYLYDRWSHRAWQTQHDVALPNPILDRRITE